jgi:hypothetical protein
LLVLERSGRVQPAENVEVRLADHLVKRSPLTQSRKPPGADQHEPALTVFEKEPFLRAREKTAHAQTLDLFSRYKWRSQIRTQAGQHATLNATECSF